MKKHTLRDILVEVEKEYGDTILLNDGAFSWSVDCLIDALDEETLNMEHWYIEDRIGSYNQSGYTDSVATWTIEKK